MKAFLINLFITFLFLALSVFYIYPAFTPLLENDQTQALSDGTDQLTAPMHYQILDDAMRSSPTKLLYGAVPNSIYDAPAGSALWIPWVEKILSVTWSRWVVVEQRGTIIVFCLLFLNALSFYLMARSFQWSRPLSVALAICWAFNPFTHARSKVHFSMVALYHLPLVIWALNLIIKKSGRQALFAATLLFLFAAMTFQYFVILTLAFLPFLVIYIWMQSEPSKFRQNLLFTIMCSAVGVIFLAWNLIRPLPYEELKRLPHHLPQTGVEKNQHGVHPFMEVFAAQPIDYLGGDIGVGIKDLNPLRQLINEHIANNLKIGNSHERANGIRWWILIGALVLLVLIFSKKIPQLTRSERRLILLFAGFALWGFWLSLSPLVFGHALGPSAWLHALIPQFRVPSRASIFAHFGLLMILGVGLNSLIQFWQQSQRQLPKLLWILPLIAILSFPPWLNPLPLSPIRPVFSSLKNSSYPCGAGLYFPYVSGTYALLQFYSFIQQLRGTGCSIFNSSVEHPRNQALLKKFALSERVIKEAEQDSVFLKENLVSFIKCTGLQWVVFDNNVNQTWKKKVCTELNWKIDSQDVCSAPFPHTKLNHNFEQCL